MCYLIGMSNKAPIREVKLRFFEDQANGQWGLAHVETYQASNGGDGFNAFWDGRGLFHDVFEHAHEFTDKHFMGEAAMNIGGEMAAMGAMWYYFDEMGLYDRQTPNARQFGYWTGDTLRRSTEGDILEAIGSGYCNFGNELISAVKRQKPTENSELECQIDIYWDNVRKYKRGGFAAHSQQEEEFANTYRKSITKSKIANLHRYGFRMAEALVPHNSENKHVLSEFISFFDAFCKDNSAEEIAKLCNYMVIKLFKDDDDRISWKAYLIGSPGSFVGELEIKEHFSLDDIYDLTLAQESDRE